MGLARLLHLARDHGEGDPSNGVQVRAGSLDLEAQARLSSQPPALRPAMLVPLVLS